MEENTIDFEEFLNFDEEPGNQTEEIEEQEPETTEAPEETEEQTEEVEAAEETHAEPQTFTLKVNKEERTVSLDEMTALAQKGADYDRVKSQVESGRAENQKLTEQLAETQAAYDIISEIAKGANASVPDFLDQLRISRIMEQENVSQDVASERLARIKAEARIKELEKKSAPTEEEKQKERYNREVAEFQKLYPDVDMESLPVESMAQDIANGMSMVGAYQKWQNAKLAEENKQLQEQLEAQKQNQKNRKAPGSASDSGSMKPKDQYDEFLSGW